MRSEWGVKLPNSNRGNGKKENYGVLGLVKASFLFEDGYIIQFEGSVIKIKEPNSKELSIYENVGKSFPDAMNAMEIKRQHLQNPQLFFLAKR